MEDFVRPMIEVVPHKNKDKPARNDEKPEELDVIGYDGKIFRFGTIGDGNCFIHALLQAGNQDYMDVQSYSYRVTYAQIYREKWADSLSLIDPMTGCTFYESCGFKELCDLNLPGPYDDIPDYSMESLQMLLSDSTLYLGDEMRILAQKMLHINVLMIQSLWYDIRLISGTDIDEKLPIIVLNGTGNHWELVGEDDGSDCYKVCFQSHDPFIKFLCEKKNH